MWSQGIINRLDLDRLIPEKRLQDRSLGYYFKSLFQWHDETLNCWTNILAMAILAYTILLECDSEWGLYVGCLSFTTNFSSLIAHLFISKNFRTECIVFAFDLFGAVLLGSLLAMSFVGFAFSSPHIVTEDIYNSSNEQLNFISRHLDYVVLAVRVLGCILLSSSSTIYVKRCGKEFRMHGAHNSMHVDVVKCIAHSFPLCAMIMIPTALYTGRIYPVIFITLLLGSTRTLLAACNKWHKQRWLLHSISHLTGALLVATEIIELAENTTDSRVKHMTRTLPYYLFIDGISILILCVVMLIVHNKLQLKSNKD
ncbi:uncharacterized protein LOC142349930 [Convolutriloba macropyga]|uniref:uncharacterized protein LOC142349930 n=1 Tax=Convolutriloba macropyga TaxID=536237 RepID=UPI003F52001B